MFGGKVPDQEERLVSLRLANPPRNLGLFSASRRW